MDPSLQIKQRAQGCLEQPGALVNHQLSLEGGQGPPGPAADGALVGAGHRSRGDSALKPDQQIQGVQFLDSEHVTSGHGRERTGEHGSPETATAMRGPFSCRQPQTAAQGGNDAAIASARFGSLQGREASVSILCTPALLQGSLGS